MEAPVYDPTTGVPVYTTVDGLESPAESDTPCGCCGNKKNVPPTICTGHATCNDFCTGYAARHPDSGLRFDLSECCECPCPDRKAYPLCYSVSGSIAIATSYDAGGSHYDITPGTLDFASQNTRCSGHRSQATFHAVEYIGGVFHGEGDFVVQMDATASAINDCPDRGKIDVSVSVSIVSGTGTAATPGSSFLGSAHQQVGDACKSGSGTIFGNSESIAGYGSFTVTPSCDDCADEPGSCGIVDGESPSVCGDEIAIQFEHDTGTVDGGGNEIWELITGALTKLSTCGWGAGLSGASASIQTTPIDEADNPCCPDCDCNDCDGDCPASCFTCWTLSLSAGVDSETISLGNGSCPPSGTYNGIKFRNIVLSDASGCA